MSNTVAKAPSAGDVARPGHNDIAPRVAHLGPPPLLPGEDADLYDELSARVASAFKPQDFIEELWARDVVDLVWEARRLRRLKSELLAAAAPEALKELLSPLVGWKTAADLVSGWTVGNRGETKRVDHAFAKAGLTMESVMARALALKLDDVERFDRMIRSAESRRDSVLREVERHRRDVAARLREAAAAAAEDATFEEIGPPAAAAE